MSKAKGFWGESIAAQILESWGWTILAKNYRYSGGEIDIIAQDHETFVFVEVKTWDFASDDILETSISNKKRQKIFNTAAVFLQRELGSWDVSMRFDVLFISLCGKKIKHFPGAFTEAGFL